MDKHTLSQYGWVVSVILVLAIMISLATPFASVLSNGFKGAVNDFKDTGSGVLDNLGGAEDFGDLNIGGGNHGDGGMENTGPVILDGQNQSFHKLAPSALTFRSSANIDDFTEVKVNGETVDPANYTLTEGSTVITFSIDYLQTLDAGAQEVAIVSKTGSPSADFDVIEPEVNEHGFYYNQPYTAYVNMYSSDVAFFLRDNNTLDLIVISPNTTTTADYTETCTYSCEGNNISVDTSIGTVTGTVTNDGGLYINELAANFVLSSEVIAADNDYFYIYDNSLAGYRVAVINGEKSSYNAILSNINNVPVVSIKDTFSYNANLTAMPQLPNTITTIGGWAFINCTSLTSVTIPNTVFSIDTHAFDGCKNLTRLSIPDSVTSIGVTAFGGCSSLTEIRYGGTKEQWNNNVSKGTSWNNNTGNYVVYCTDGEITKS